MPPGFKTYRLRLICRQTPRPIACGLYAATVRKLPPSHNSRSVSTIFATIVHLKSRHLMTNITSPLCVTSLLNFMFYVGGLYAATKRSLSLAAYMPPHKNLQPYSRGIIQDRQRKMRRYQSRTDCLYNVMLRGL